MLSTFSEMLLVGFAGLVLGSFSTALSWRVPRGESWVWKKVSPAQRKLSAPLYAGRSACPSCGKALAVHDLVPLFSWLFLRGRCRFCAAPIGARYPLIELGTLLAALGGYAAWGFSPALLFLLLALPFLVALFVIDLEHYILPDQLVLPLAVIGGAFVLSTGWPMYGISVPLFMHAVLPSVGAAFLYGSFAWGAGALLSFFLKKDALGGGDVKFFAVAGLWLGISAFPFFLILSGFAGVFLGLLWRGLFKTPVFPFGPALIVSFYILLLSDGWEWFSSVMPFF